jgi:hypothetical protein
MRYRVPIPWAAFLTKAAPDSSESNDQNLWMSLGEAA